jgi:catalase (peroxidase I)
LLEQVIVDTIIMVKSLLVLISLSALATCGAKCPFLQQQEAAARNKMQPIELQVASTRRALNERTGDGGIPDGGFAAVKEDIVAMLTNSQDFWPADFGHYGGLMIRLAWHCSGSFRETDGRGGCDGGRIRFDPELTWMDNGNLDKALKLLEPIKEKYGTKLSWGDLIVLTGTTAMEDMGLAPLGFCGGRIDDPDGSNSLILGPSDEQESIARCLSLNPSQQGMCNLVEGSAIGPTTIGLIYVNPSGPINDTDNPVAAGPDVRRTFGRMGFNDTETVALVGGGHAFGKCHGACMDPPCGQGEMQGKGNNTFTAGYEGQWSSTPTKWSNEYFQNLFKYNWTLVDGPGGLTQWAPNTTDFPNAIMLTADLALAQDETYRPISQEYANNIDLLAKDFGAAWYRLTSSDMGPATRCIGEYVLPPQHWQHTLPEFEGELPDFVAVRAKIQELLDADDTNYDAFVNLAYQCANTFRETDYRGGCNGARIRFAPESEWEVNAGTADALATLEAVKGAFPNASYADIIVLAGQTAIESAGGEKQPFCGGRVDAEDGSGSENLQPRVYDPAVVSIRDDMQVKGLSAREGVALAGRPTGSNFTNQFYIDLLAGNGNFTEDQAALLEDEFKDIVEVYAGDEATFQKEFASAWNKLMTADRYDGPFKNACTSVSTCTTDPCYEATVDEGTGGGAGENATMTSTAAHPKKTLVNLSVTVVASIAAAIMWY